MYICTSIQVLSYEVFYTCRFARKDGANHPAFACHVHWFMLCRPHWRAHVRLLATGAGLHQSAWHVIQSRQHTQYPRYLFARHHRPAIFSKRPVRDLRRTMASLGLFHQVLGSDTAGARGRTNARVGACQCPVFSARCAVHHPEHRPCVLVKRRALCAPLRGKLSQAAGQHVQ